VLRIAHARRPGREWASSLAEKRVPIKSCGGGDGKYLRWAGSRPEYWMRETTDLHHNQQT